MMNKVDIFVANRDTKGFKVAYMSVLASVRRNAQREDMQDILQIAGTWWNEYRDKFIKGRVIKVEESDIGDFIFYVEREQE